LYIYILILIVERSHNFYSYIALVGRVGIILRRMAYFVSKLRSITYLNQAGKTANNLFIIPHKYLSTLTQIAWTYVVIDVILKANNVKYKGKDVVFISCLDTTIWHMFASFIIPGFILKTTLNVSHSILSIGGRFRNRFTSLTPILLGFALLPFMIQPVDNFTSYMMNNSLRKTYSHLLVTQETPEMKKL